MFLVTLLFLQQSDVAPPIPDIVRKLTAKEVVTYDGTVTTMGDQVVRNVFTMQLRVLPEDGKKGEYPLQFDLLDLDSDLGTQTIKRPTFGTIRARALSTGFLEELTFRGSAMAFALPLLSFWLPTDKMEPGKWADVKTPTYDGAASFVGTGRAMPIVEGEQDLTFDSHLRLFGENPDRSHMRKFRMRVTVSAKDGLVDHADGKYIAADGTVSYTIQRR
jgi:hypothetical protein